MNIYIYIYTNRVSTHFEAFKVNDEKLHTRLDTKGTLLIFIGSKTPPLTIMIHNGP